MGIDTGDDAAVYRLSEDLAIINTVDFFPPIVDDPFEFGAISATNSISDVYAMGGKPVLALNVVCFPEDQPIAVLTKILEGGSSVASEAAMLIAGGHTIKDSEPKYGMAVTGIINPSKLVKNIGAQPGDFLVLTKPIGTGVISTAIKKEKASDTVIESAVKSMIMLNKKASETLQEFNPNAVTDVTGFGLVGHLIEICKNSQVSANINFSQINFLPGVIDLANKGIISGGTKRNLDYAEKFAHFSGSLSPTQKLLACDAQTSGGLLISLPETEANRFISIYGDQAVKIGNVAEQNNYFVSINS